VTFTAEKLSSEKGEKSDLDRLRELGVEIPEELEGDLEKTIAELGEDFFAEVESGAELYWTFSPFGEDIIESGKIVPGAKAPVQVTEKHSRGVHFVKPGIFPKYALENINYMRYARINRTLGYNPNAISSTFGIAVAFPASYLASVTPYRQAPRHKSKEHQTEQDIVFFKSDEKDSTTDYEYDLRKAYVFIMSRNGMRSDPRFKDIYEGENLTRLHAEGKDPLYEVAKIVFRSYGYSEEWIKEHVIHLPEKEIHDSLSKKQWEYGGLKGVDDDDKRDVATLTLASRKTHSMMGQDDSVVIPIRVQMDRALEHTDDSFLIQQSRLEELAVLPIAKDNDITSNEGSDHQRETSHIL